MEVVIDAMHGQPEAVVRESADLLYNLVVLWVHAGVHPDQVWSDMRRRELMFGIAEKAPKDLVRAAARRKWWPWRPGACASAAISHNSPHGTAMTAEAAEPRSLLRRLYDWCLAAAYKPHALWTMGAISFAESSFFPRAARRDADPDGAGAAGAGLRDGGLVHGHVGGRWSAWLHHRRRALQLRRRLADPLYGYGDKVEAFRDAYAQWGAWIILLKGLYAHSVSRS